MKTNFILFILTCINLNIYSQVEIKFNDFLLGSPFELIVVAKDSAQADLFFKESVIEVKRIENLISDWKPNTEVSKINNNAGIQTTVVSEEVFQLLERAVKISEISNGAFDITFASIEKVWKFDGSLKKIPSEEEIRNSIKKINYKNIIFDKNINSIFLKENGMKIGLGGIGQGYIADKIKEKLTTLGCKSSVINVSGDVFAWGENLKNEDWKIGIINPFNKSEIIAYFPIQNSAVQTSGNYEKFVEIDGKKYAHIINPKTGMPITEIASVSVFAPTTELADALSTAVFVMGVKDGLELINKLKNTECIIIDINKKIHLSNKINQQIINENKN
jgi:thiamine biosynthesis lipoprotein